MNSTVKKNNSSVCAIIPFYNEEKTIYEIIEKTLHYVDFIICIDDGSTDNSLKKIPEREKLFILKNETNYGKGYSLRKGFEKSIEQKFVYTITLDADLQHPPEYIPTIIEKLKSGADFVIGNRLNNLNKMPIPRILSNKTTSRLLSLKTKQEILDSQCGFRGFRTEILSYILPSFKGFEAESEMIVKAANKNFNIDFINIPAVYGNEQSKMRPFQTIKGFVKVLLS